MTPAAIGLAGAFASGAGIDLATAERIADDLDRHGDRGEHAHRVRHLRDELSSHILAARLLADAGASAAAVAEVGRRARAVLDEIDATSARSVGDRPTASAV